MKRTQLLDVISRKLAPFVMLFGCYLIAFAYRTPGGGFQGGVVLASGVILLVLGREIRDVERIFPAHIVHAVEVAAFLGLLVAASAGIWTGGGILAYPLGKGVQNARGFLSLLNLLIGLKVGAGITLLALTLFQGDSE